jgi:hypothetical protein
LAANLSAFVGFNDIAAKEFFIVQVSGNKGQVLWAKVSVSWSVFACSFCSVFRYSVASPQKRRVLPFIVQCNVFIHYFLTNAKGCWGSMFSHPFYPIIVKGILLLSNGVWK